MAAYRFGLISLVVVLSVAGLLARSPSPVPQPNVAGDRRPDDSRQGQEAGGQARVSWMASTQPDGARTSTALQADELHCAGIYEGTYGNGKTHSFRFHPTGRATVSVERPGKTVALVLTSYEPVIWSVQAGPGTRISDIILSGYYKQSVEGAEKARVSCSSQEVPGSFPYFLLYGDDTNAGLESVRALTGMPIANMHQSYVAPNPIAFKTAPER